MRDLEGRSEEVQGGEGSSVSMVSMMAQLSMPHFWVEDGEVFHLTVGDQLDWQLEQGSVDGSV